MKKKKKFITTASAVEHKVNLSKIRWDYLKLFVSENFSIYFLRKNLRTSKSFYIYERVLITENLQLSS